jgi:DNA-directed RNA polymerase subunit F
LEKEIVERNLVPVAEVRRILEKRQKEGELKYTQRITLEHAQRFAKISAARSFALINLLKSDFNLTDSLSVQIVNMLPRYLDEIRVFFTGQKIGVLPRSDEEIILILKSLMEYTFSVLIEQQLDLPEAKVIKLLQAKPRSLKEVISTLSLRGKGKEEKAKDAFEALLKVQIISRLIVEHALLPKQAIDVISVEPLTIKALGEFFGKDLTDSKALSGIFEELQRSRKTISLATNFKIPLSISQMIAESPPTTIDELKKLLGAVGEKMENTQLKKILKAITISE